LGERLETTKQQQQQQQNKQTKNKIENNFAEATLPSEEEAHGRRQQRE